MFNNFRILVSTMNLSEGEADDVIRESDEQKAYQKFFDKLSQLGGNPQTKKVMVKLLDKNGDVLKTEIIDNSKYITPVVEVVEEPTESEEVVTE